MRTGRTIAEPQQDPLTGLPNREAAEDAIAGLKGNSSGVFVAAIYVQRLEQINARLGDRTGNELLFLSAQRIVNGLRPGDQIFRWRGPAFVAVLARKEALLEVRREMQRLVSSRFNSISGAEP